MTRLVYRLEDKNKRGPYYGSVGYGWQTVDHSWYAGRPEPMNDGITRFTRDHYCGFSSMTKLKRWFPKTERRNLAKLGFSIAVYVAPKEEVELGKRQVVFNRSKAVIQETRCLLAA